MRPRRLVGGEEHEAGAVAARHGQGEGEDGAEERVGHLDEDAGAVAGARVGAGRPAVFEVDQEVEGLPHDVV